MHPGIFQCLLFLAVDILSEIVSIVCSISYLIIHIQDIMKMSSVLTKRIDRRFNSYHEATKRMIMLLQTPSINLSTMVA